MRRRRAPSRQGQIPRRGAARLYRARQCRRRHRRQEDQLDPAGRLGCARQGPSQRQEAHLAGQRDLLINASHAPVTAEAKRAGVPRLFSPSARPEEVYPPATPLQFCTTALASSCDSRAALATGKSPGIQPTASCGVRGEVDPGNKCRVTLWRAGLALAHKCQLADVDGREAAHQDRKHA